MAVPRGCVWVVPLIGAPHPHPHPHRSGAVVTLECVEKLIRKDMVDPVNGEKLTDRDIIVLQRVSGPPPQGPAPSRGPASSPGLRPLPQKARPSRPRPFAPGPAPALPSPGPASPCGPRTPRGRLQPPASTLAFSPSQGGTGFAGSGVKLQAEKSRPVMQA